MALIAPMAPIAPISLKRKNHNNYMTRLTKYTIHLISGLLLALLTVGCVADRNVSDCVAEGEEVELEFALKVPALETNLRQLTKEQESQVKSVKVLVFNTQDASGNPLNEPDETFAYAATMTTTNFTPDQDGVTHVVCRLRATDKPMRIVCIANHNVPENILVEGTAKKTILEDAQMKKVFDENGWKTDGTQFIPMWGESDAQPVNKGTRFNSCAKLAYGNAGQNRNNEGVIHLVRALARVDVGVNFEDNLSSETAAGSADFKIKSVRVYRYATSMYVAGTQATAFNFANNRRNALPHTPEGVSAAIDAKPLVFTAQTEEDAKGYVRNIYIPEIENKTKAKDARICLVVGGSYKGGKETYYRVDFIKRETKSPNDIITEQLDILRNYRYRFNITKVAGPGTDTPEEALTTEPVNINWDVLVWDDADIDKIVYDGQYYLSVSKDKFHFGKDATSESYTIRTNWPKGYQIVDANGKEWAKSETEAGTQGTWAYFTEPAGQTFEIDKDKVSTVNVLANAGDPRSIPTPEQLQKKEQQLFVKAGRIKWPLQITQSDKIELDVKVYHYESDNWRADCSKMPIDAYTCVVNTPQKFWVKFTEGAKLGRIPLDRDEQFKWKRIQYDEDNGIALFEVVVKAEDISEEDFWTSEITKFRTVKGDSKAETDFTLRVMKWDAIPYKDPGFKYNMLKKEPVYALAPYNRQFYIRANAPYTLTVNKIEIEKLDGNPQESEVVKGWHDGKLIDDKTQPAYRNGEVVRFRSYDYLTGTDKGLGGRIIAAHVTLTLAPKAKSGEEGYFETKTFKIHFVAGIIQPEANTYVVEAGQVPILIPCSQINKAHDWMAQYKDEITRMMKNRMDISGGQAMSKKEYENYVQLQGEWGELATLNPNETDWTAKPVWSTLHPTGDEHGLKDVHPVNIDIAGRNYIFVQPKPEWEGCVLISAIKNDKIIWNWTIWVVKKIADGGHGYPWDDADNGTNGAPYMNRNLGAYRMASDGTRTIYYDKYINDMAGLYYRHGTPIPHHAYDVNQGPQNDTKGDGGSTHCSKPWYDTSIVTANKQTNLSNNKYTGLVASLQSINDLIQNPDKFAYKDKLAENILEFGSNEISSALGKASWQGGDGQTVLNNEYNFRNFKYGTQKTPFDPSPYGWKVPAAGMESVGMTENPNITFSKTGAFISGNANGFASKTTGNGVILHCATCYSNSDMRLISFYVFGRDRWSFTNTAGAFGTGDVKNHSSGNYNVRCIENEEESDYRDYTQDAVLSNAFRATKAARRYHR